jgi:hypothetical protein
MTQDQQKLLEKWENHDCSKHTFSSGKPRGICYVIKMIIEAQKIKDSESIVEVWPCPHEECKSKAKDHILNS